MDVLIYLTGISIILLLGLLLTILSNKIKIPNMLLLLIAGILTNFITYNGEPLFDFPPVFLASLATLALVMIVFDGSSKMSYRDIDKLSYKTLKLTIVSLIINIVVIGFLTNIFFFKGFSLQNIVLSIVFAVLMTATDPASVFFMFKNKISKALEFLRIESIVNTPIIVLIPFILLDLIKAGNSDFLIPIGPFIQQIITGIGAGIVVGLIMFKAMKKVYSEEYSPIALLTATLITYVLAEQLGGNGVLAVATLGLLFGNMYVKRKISLAKFNSLISGALEIMVFILIGSLTKLPWTDYLFFVKAIIVFIFIIVCRYISLLLIKTDFNKKELFFMSMSMPKGIAVASVIFTIALFEIQGINLLLNLVITGMLLSFIVSTVTAHSAHKLILLKKQDKEQVVS